MKAKVISALVVLPIIIGTVFLANSGGPGKELSLMPTLFLCFFGVIVAVQAVPAVMLFVVLIREIFHRSVKTKEGAEADLGQGR